jgi:hypothetical protein
MLDERLPKDAMIAGELDYYASDKRYIHRYEPLPVVDEP